jgi:hypothetical protein
VRRESQHKKKGSALFFKVPLVEIRETPAETAADFSNDGDTPNPAAKQRKGMKDE